MIRRLVFCLFSLCTVAASAAVVVRYLGRRLLVAGLMLFGLAVASHAATYSLPAAIGSLGTPFSTCSLQSGTSYQCPGNVAVGNSDTIDVSSNMTLNVAGNFTLGNSGVINCSPGKLSIVAGGNVTFGNTPNACANITAGGNVQVGNNGFITGNIVAGGGISLGNNTNVDGICTPAPTGGSCGTPPSLTKVASTSAAAVGDTITFTITAQNLSGSAVSSIAITDVLPAGMVYSTHVTTLGTAMNNSGTVTWSIPSLAAGGSAQLTLVVSLTQQGSKTNTVTSPGSTSASATVLVLASAITHFKLDEPVGSWTGAAGEVLDSGGTALHGKRVTSSTPTIPIHLYRRQRLQRNIHQLLVAFVMPRHLMEKLWSKWQKVPCLITPTNFRHRYGFIRRLIRRSCLQFCRMTKIMNFTWIRLASCIGGGGVRILGRLRRCH